MANVVYWTTNIKPSDDIVVSNGLRLLAETVSRREITGQTYVAQPPRRDDEGHRGAAFRLTETGMVLFSQGTVPPPDGFRVWPDDVPEPANFEPVGGDDDQP